MQHFEATDKFLESVFKVQGSQEYPGAVRLRTVLWVGEIVLYAIVFKVESTTSKCGFILAITVALVACRVIEE